MQNADFGAMPSTDEDTNGFGAGFGNF